MGTTIVPVCLSCQALLRLLKIEKKNLSVFHNTTSVTLYFISFAFHSSLIFFFSVTLPYMWPLSIMYHVCIIYMCDVKFLMLLRIHTHTFTAVLQFPVWEYTVTLPVVEYGGCCQCFIAEEVFEHGGSPS